MTHTQNYNLTQWSPEDRILRSDFNTDNAAIDTALADHAAQLASLTSGKGNCKIWVSSYAGTGTTSRSVTFPKLPIMAFVLEYYGSFLLLAPLMNHAINIVRTSNPGRQLPLTWSGSTARWSCDDTSSYGPDYAFNTKGLTYSVVAFYAAS